MRKWLISASVVLVSLLMARPVAAQVKSNVEAESVVDKQEATGSGEATPSGIVEKVVEKKPDLTEPEGEVKGKLEKYLEEQRIGPLGVSNVLRYAVREAVRRGVPANIIVLVLLFPVVAAIIAASRHLLGLRGFGLFTPAVLSVAFVATGIVVGIFLFLVILAVATVGRIILKRLRLQYLPRMALLLWFVSLGVFGALFAAPFINLEALVKVGIFPILILILLAENFIEVQMGKSQREAIELTVETIILALICSLILSFDTVQKFAILNPEILVLGVAVFNTFIGKYVGLRLSEYLKFRKLLK